MKNLQRGFLIPIVIIVVALLAIGGGIYFYTNNKIEIPLGTVAPALTSGIVVTSLKENDLVKLPITIEGYLDGKGWTANEGEIGTVEIFDSTGKSISNKEIIPTTSDWMKFPTNFKVMVGDREMMSHIKTDSGFVKIISNGAKDSDQTKTLTIPVRFDK